MVSVVSEPEELTEIRCVTILANIVTLYAVKNHLKRPKSTWGGGGGEGGYIQNNIFVCKLMGLNPEGALTWDFTIILHPS